MIQYKLIKVYPEHTLGEIHCADKSTKWYGTIFYDAYPEFWKRVEEVDYEILSFNCKAKDITSDGAYLWNSMRNEWFHCKDDLDFIIKKYGIKSVKRLSDGEVFTIGDNSNYDHYSNFNKITKISIVQKGNIKEGVWVNYAGGSCHLSIAKKLPKKTPLFTTEDGVEIFEGDTYYFIFPDFYIGRTEKANGIMNGSLATFSTKEKAEEYILLNKPCLSLNNLLSVWGDAEAVDLFKSSLMFKKFEKLAKSKL